jgi:hypothetical protein
MKGWDRDPEVRRFERDALIALAGLAAAALVVGRGNPRGAVGVALGGLLVGASYIAIKGGVDLLLARRAAGAAESAPGLDGSGAASRSGRCGAVWRAVAFLGRFALLALAAYVMLARFHAHPVGILAGVTAPFLAAMAQLPRLRRRAGRLR